MELTFSIHPDPMLIADGLDALALELESEEGPMGRSLDALIASIDRSFADQGPGWEPWSISYSMSRGRPHGPLEDQETLLVRTAELIAGATDPGSYAVEFDRIEWTGAAAPDYADYHLEGTVKMPQRSFLHVDEFAQEEILAIWEEWMGDKVEGVAMYGRF